MTKVKQDELSIYVVSGGYIARPIIETQYKEGDEVDTKHFAASPHHGVGLKNRVPIGTGIRSRIIWEEMWVGCGMNYDFKNMSLSEKVKEYDYAKRDKDIIKIMVDHQ